MAVASDGVTYFIADTGGNRIRRVDADVAFASTRLTGREARTTRLRFVVTSEAVVLLRVARRGKVVATRRVQYHAGGRKRLSLRRLRAGAYSVAITATDGAAQDVDRAKLRVLPQRSRPSQRRAAPAGLDAPAA